MLFGLEEKIALFKKLKDNGTVGHAYLFFGDLGIGKRTFALHFASFMEGGDFEETAGTLLDTQVFHRGEDEASLGIDAVRKIRNFCSETPFRSPRRIAIVDDADFFTPEAQGALLKIVEDSPPHATIIFIASKEESLFPPLLSRLSKVYFPRMRDETLQEALQESMKISKKEAEAIAKDSFGRFGRAYELLNASEKKEPPLLEELEKRILSLWRKDVFANAKKLEWLLDREMMLKRYSLNPNLQKKAIVYHESYD